MCCWWAMAFLYWSFIMLFICIICCLCSFAVLKRKYRLLPSLCSWLERLVRDFWFRLKSFGLFGPFAWLCSHFSCPSSCCSWDVCTGWRWLVRWGCKVLLGTSFAYFISLIINSRFASYYYCKDSIIMKEREGMFWSRWKMIRFNWNRQAKHSKYCLR